MEKLCHYQIPCSTEPISPSQSPMLITFSPPNYQQYHQPHPISPSNHQQKLHLYPIKFPTHHQLKLALITLNLSHHLNLHQASITSSSIINISPTTYYFKSQSPTKPNAHHAHISKLIKYKIP